MLTTADSTRRRITKTLNSLIQRLLKVSQSSFSWLNLKLLALNSEGVSDSSHRSIPDISVPQRNSFRILGAKGSEMTHKAATAQGRANPFKRLAYVYIGTSDYDADHEFYEKRLGADVVWEFRKFGARVAAFDLCGEPYLL